MENLTKCYCRHTTTCDCGELSKIEMLAIEERNNKNLKSVISSFIVGYEKAQETLYSEEDLREAFLQGWMIRERFEDISPDIIYPKGLDYEEKQHYAFKLWFNKFKKK